MAREEEGRRGDGAATAAGGHATGVGPPAPSPLRTPATSRPTGGPGPQEPAPPESPLSLLIRKLEAERAERHRARGAQCGGRTLDAAFAGADADGGAAGGAPAGAQAAQPEDEDVGLADEAFAGLKPAASADASPRE
eukprot:5602526-Pleurochrysis_carterae.AAC.1